MEPSPLSTPGTTTRDDHRGTNTIEDDRLQPWTNVVTAPAQCQPPIRVVFQAAEELVQSMSHPWDKTTWQIVSNGRDGVETTHGHSGSIWTKLPLS
ncbi:hypothetical protein ZWY2020_021326 [Hordeum vulgare]|nr:hypothetical protein ZWY2020_021326 [Hordeum vulgare]